MDFQVEPYVDVRAHAATLGLNSPSGMAFLPRNFSDVCESAELTHESSVTTLRILFRQAGLTEDRLEHDGEPIPALQENAFELLLPTLFVGALAMSSSPAAVSVALGIIANYATEFFKGIGGAKRVKFSIVLTDRTDACKRYKYTGAPEGLKEFSRIVERIGDGDGD